MKKIITFLTFVSLFLTAGNLFAQTNTWDGSSSVSWSVADNWSLGHVPTSAEDVVIPSAPANQPTLSGIAGVCKNLTVNSGATLTISATTMTNGTLTASGNATMNGALSIGGALTKTGKLVAVNITWGSTSSVSGYINSGIELSGNWEFSTGSAITMGYCGVTFTGATNTDIISKSSSSSFSGATISKSSGNTVSVSSLSTSTLKFNGILTINSGSTLMCGANITTIFYSNINNSGHFSFSSGTVSFEKTSGTQAIQVNSGDLFNNLVINSGGTVTINNYLQVMNDVTITAGTFDPLGNTVVLFGDWSNTVGAAGFTEGTSRVVFSGGNYHQYSSTETFNILEVHKAIGGAFRANGTNVTCAQYEWTAGSVDVLNNGTFTANDLADNGIFGGWYVNPGSTVNLYQDAGQFVDLNGSLTFTGGGNFNVYGGSAVSVWAAGGNASVTMDGGVLDFKNQGVQLITAVPYTLTTAITGGTIRTSGDFYSNRATFNPTGGTIELYGPVNADVTVAAGSLWTLTIDKTAGSLVSLESNLTLGGTLNVQNSTFSALNKDITVASSIMLNWDGVFLLGAGSQLKMASGKYLYVNNGGTLKTEGAPSDMVNITHSAGYYYILVQGNGTVSARHTYFQYLYNINFQNGSFLDPLNAFYKCTFTNSSVASNAVIVMGTTQDISIHEADFPTMISAHTVYKPNNAGRVTFKDATGAFAGAANESDPFNLIDWRSSTPGLWTGEISTDWFTAQNWDDAVVPTSATNVTIPAGAPRYPVIISGDAYCNNMNIQTGAEFSMTDGNLTVAGNFSIYGHLSMIIDYPEITVEGSVFWENGSTAHVTSGAFHVKTDWEFRNGSAAVMNSSMVSFEGNGISYIRSFEANSAFFHLYNNKETGSVYVSNTSTDTLKVNGRICVPGYGSSFYANSTLPIVIKENLWATGPVYCPQGTIIFKGPSSVIQLVSGGYLNNVIINTVGNVALNDSIVVNGNLTIESGALVPDGNPVHVKGNWINNVGTDGFVEGTGLVVFEGSAGSDILTDETFYNLNIEKTYTGYDGVEFGDSISVQGDLLIKSGTMEMNYGSRLYIGNKLKILTGAGLNANDSDVMIYSAEDWIDNNLTTTTTTGFNAGTSSIVYFLGKPANIQTIYEKCPFNHVVVAGTGTYCRPDTDDMLCRTLTISSGTFRVYAHTVRISENLTIGAGTLRMDLVSDLMEIDGSVIWLPGSNALITSGTIRVRADWHFNDGTNASLGTGNTVILDGIATNFIVNDDADAAFGNLEFAKPSPYPLTYIQAQVNDTVRVAGSLTVNEFNNLSVNGSRMIVNGNFDIRPTGFVNAHLGYLQLNEAAVVLEGKLDVNHGTVLLKGTFEEAATGELVIPGGTFKSDAPATGGWQQIGGIFTMSGGTFEIARNGIKIGPTATTSVNGGSMISGFGFHAITTGTFQPAGGTVKVNYTPSYYTGLTCTNGNYFNDVEINAPCLMGSDLTIKDDLLITASGSLDSDFHDIYILGDWTDLAWPVGFEPHNNLVTFAGPNDTDVLTSANFYNLVVMKTNVNVSAIELAAGKSIEINNDLTISDGCLKLNTATSLTIANDLLIASGAGLDAGAGDVNIAISGDWTNNNVTRTTAVGFYSGTGSQVSFTSTGDSYLTTSGAQEMFNKLTILKPGFSFRSNDNIACASNLLIEDGYWEDNEPGLHHIVYGDFTVGPYAALMNASAQNTFEFSGGSSGLAYRGVAGCFHDVIISKFAYANLYLNSDLYCLFNGNLTLESGTLGGTGRYLWVEGDINVNATSVVDLTASEVVLTNLNALNVNEAGSLYLKACQIHADVSTARYALNVNSGGLIYADNTIFRNMGINGVYLKEGSYTDFDFLFQGCSFLDGAAGGTLLRIDNNEDLTLLSVIFPANTWGGASNVTKSVNAGHVYFVDYTGDYAGEANDNDPYGLVTWVPVMSAAPYASPSTVCPGSSTQLFPGVTGGQPPYTYHWAPEELLSDPNVANPIATLSLTTTFELWVTDFLGTDIFVNFNVDVVPLLPVSVTITASANPSPQGSYVLFTATPVNGGTSPAYQWKVNGMNVGTGLSTYSYVPANGDDVECVMTSNYACASGNPAPSNTITMIVMPANVAVNGIVSAPLSLCFDASNTITVAGSGNTFLVETGASVTMIAGVKISYLYGTTVQPGGYLHGYITTSNSYCGSSSPSMVTVVTSETETLPELQLAANRFVLFPNPTSGPFTLLNRGESDPGNVEVEMFDLRGKHVMSASFAGGRSHDFELSGLPTGLYLVKVISGGRVESFKLILTP